MYERFLNLTNILARSSLKNADAIIWLQGDRYDRARKTLNLWKTGRAPRIVITGNNEFIGSGTRPGENNISLKEMAQWLESRGVPSSAIMIDKKSFNTRDQARNVLQIARQKNWKRIILVSSLYDQARAFLTFLKETKRKAWPGELSNQTAFNTLVGVPGGRMKSAGELLKEEFGKIEKYKHDVASIGEGMSYLQKCESFKQNDKEAL